MGITVSRVKAFLVHFAISVSVISIFLYFVLFIWYPSPFDYFYSPTEVLKIVLGVDLVLGPLLTLVVFDIKKKSSELRRDILLIVLIQVAAFSWGVHVTYNARPLFVAYSETGFSILGENDIDVTKLTDKTLKPLFWESPRYVYVNVPLEPDEIKAMLESIILHGKPEIRFRTDLYVPLESKFDYISQFSIDIAEKMKQTKVKELVNDFLQNSNSKMSDLVFFSVNGSSKKGILVFNNKGKLLGLIEYNFYVF